MDAENTTEKKAVGLKIILAVIILAALGFGTWYLLKDDGVSGGAAVATINGKKFTENEFEKRLAQARVNFEAQGVDFTNEENLSGLKKQVVQDVINEKIILMDAEAKGLTVTNEEVDAQFVEIKNRFETEVEFNAELEKAKFSQDDLRDQIKRQISVQKYVAEITKDKDLSVSDEEIETFYNDTKESQGGSAEGEENAFPPLSELKVQIEEQISQQKVAQIVQARINELKSEWTINIDPAYE